MKKKETFSAAEVIIPVVPARRGRPKKVKADVPTELAGEHVLITLSSAEERLKDIQRKYSAMERELQGARQEYDRLSKRLGNMKLLLASYYNLDESGTDRLIVPEKKTTYWYVRASFGNSFFDVHQSEWIGGVSDKFRYCRGNFFLDEHTATMVCRACNAMLARI